jgi:uncharacterized protein
MDDQLTAVTPAPAGPDIARRDLRFDTLEHCDLRGWHPEGLHVAHFFNALSIFFPKGETFFIDSVRHFADRVRSPRLRRDVSGFVGQEAMHSREHRRYNRALAQAGLPVAALKQALARRLALVRSLTSPEEQLAITIALEHFTAIMADVALDAGGVFAGADPRMTAVWRWHAIEETEHKAVAYDVYAEVTAGTRSAYWRRVRVMLLTTLTFWTLVFLYHLRLVRADGALWDVRGWGRLVRFLWLRPGVLRRLLRPWLAYFRADFHPWQHDNRDLVADWKASYAATGTAPA